jgi:hypothetical protein
MLTNLLSNEARKEIESIKLPCSVHIEIVKARRLSLWECLKHRPYEIGLSAKLISSQGEEVLRDYNLPMNVLPGDTVTFSSLWCGVELAAEP